MCVSGAVSEGEKRGRRGQRMIGTTASRGASWAMVRNLVFTPPKMGAMGELRAEEGLRCLEGKRGLTVLWKHNSLP